MRTQKGKTMDELISRQSAIDAVEFGITYAKAIDVNTGESKELFKEGNDALSKAVERLKELPSAEQAWTTEEVAEILANLTGDECACNYNGIDEWLPERCKYAESTCPNPKEKHGCWMQFLLQGGADMKGEQK